MQKTSRRSFSKAIIVVLVAALALVMNSFASGQTTSKSRTLVQDTESHQDTPPMIEILDGSLIIESADQLAKTSSGGRHYYRKSTHPKLHHIKVITDSGEKIYEDLDPNGSLTKIVITWINEDKDTTGDVIITGGTVFQINSDKELQESNQNKRRKYKLEHKGQGNGKRIRIESIEITNKYGRKTVFWATPTGSGADFNPDEFRILIWRE